jgi:hypothetical protein
VCIIVSLMDRRRWQGLGMHVKRVIDKHVVASIGNFLVRGVWQVVWKVTSAQVAPFLPGMHALHTFIALGVVRAVGPRRWVCPWASLVLIGLSTGWARLVTSAFGVWVGLLLGGAFRAVL